MGEEKDKSTARPGQGEQRAGENRVQPAPAGPSSGPGSTEAEKKVDESWKEAVEKEKTEGPGEPEKPIEVNFSLFMTGLMMEALVALGEVENPVSKKKEPNMVHAKFIIDTLAMLKEKTKNNLGQDESGMLEGVLYELRMKYIAKANAKG